VNISVQTDLSITPGDNVTITVLARAAHCGRKAGRVGLLAETRQSTGDAYDTIIETITQPIQVRNTARDKPNLHE
jgi:hypothetical protein